MALVFDPILNCPRNSGLTIRVTSNGDGTVTLAWSGYNLEAVDPSGSWEVEESLDGSSWSFAFDTSPGQLGDDYGSGTLGVVNYFRVKAKDSGAATLKTSNVVTVTLPEPWELSNVVAYLDADASRLETIPGLRIVSNGGGTSPHYSAPHLSAFDGAAAMTLIFWKKEYGPMNSNQKGYIQQGCFGADGAAWVDGWSLGGGLWGGNHCADSCYLRVRSGGATYDAYLSTSGAENALGYSSNFAVTYNAGTVRIWIDGVEKTLTQTASFPATLPNSGAALLRIGRGFTSTPGNYTFCHASGYDRVLTPTEITDLTLNLDKPVLYSALTAGQKANLVFHYEHGQTECDHTANALTAVNGGGTLEYTVVAQQEPVSGEWLRAKFGRGKKLDTTGIFAASVPCLHNDADVGGTSNLSRCGLTKTVATNLYTTTTNSIFFQYKPTNVTATEAFAAALDGGSALPAEYAMPGYQFSGGANKSGLRLRSPLAASAFDGWLMSDKTVAANTAYTTFWHANAGTFTHWQDGVEGTVTPTWTIGTTPSSMAAVVGQDNLGTFAFGTNGGTWKGYEGPTLMADPKLTSAQQAQLTAYYT